MLELVFQEAVTCNLICSGFRWRIAIPEMAFGLGYMSGELAKWHQVWFLDIFPLIERNGGTNNSATESWDRACSNEPTSDAMSNRFEAAAGGQVRQWNCKPKGAIAEWIALSIFNSVIWDLACRECWFRQFFDCHTCSVWKWYIPFTKLRVHWVPVSGQVNIMTECDIWYDIIEVRVCDY